MPSTMLKIIPGTVLAAVLLVSAGAWSMGPRPGFDVDEMMSHMADELDLSETQEAEVQSLVAASREASEAEYQRMMEIRHELKTMNKDFDAGKAQQLADELGGITSRVAYRMVTTHAQIYQLLEPEQREELAALEERRDRRIEKRMKKFRD